MLRGLFAFLDTLAAVGIDLDRAIYCPRPEYGRARTMAYQDPPGRS